MAPGPPGARALYHMALPLWFKMGLRPRIRPARWRAVCVLPGVTVWLLLSLPSGEKSLFFNLAALYGLQGLSFPTRD